MTLGRDASVIIPVFNEAAGLRGLLGDLVRDDPTHAWLVVVVCNGCTDDSAEVARSFPWVVVDELETASKAHAIRRGEELSADVFPRFVIDADVSLGPGAMDALVGEAETDSPVAVAPASSWDVSARPWLVRAFYFGNTHLPRRAQWRASHVSGKGMYGTNREGRRRFGPFPIVRADDAFIDALFAGDERRVVQRASVSVGVPRTTKVLVRSIARAKLANRELATLGISLSASDRPSDTRLVARVRRTVQIWRASPFVTEFDVRRSIPYTFGFYAVTLAAFAYRVSLLARGREARWR